MSYKDTTFYYKCQQLRALILYSYLSIDIYYNIYLLYNNKCAKVFYISFLFFRAPIELEVQLSPVGEERRLIFQCNLFFLFYLSFLEILLIKSYISMFLTLMALRARRDFRFASLHYVLLVLFIFYFMRISLSFKVDYFIINISINRVTLQIKKNSNHNQK